MGQQGLKSPAGREGWALLLSPLLRSVCFCLADDRSAYRSFLGQLLSALMKEKSSQRAQQNRGLAFWSALSDYPMITAQTRQGLTPEVGQMGSTLKASHRGLQTE